MNEHPVWIPVKREILDAETQRKKAKLIETIERILTIVPDDQEPAIYRCPECRDTGVKLMIVGQYDVGGTRNGGKQRVVVATATPEHPVAVRCRCNPQHGGEE